MHVDMPCSSAVTRAHANVNVEGYVRLPQKQLAMMSVHHISNLSWCNMNALPCVLFMCIILADTHKPVQYSCVLHAFCIGCAGPAYSGLYLLTAAAGYGLLPHDCDFQGRLGLQSHDL